MQKGPPAIILREGKVFSLRREIGRIVGLPKGKRREGRKRAEGIIRLVSRREGSECRSCRRSGKEKST